MGRGSNSGRHHFSSYRSAQNSLARAQSVSPKKMRQRGLVDPVTLFGSYQDIKFLKVERNGKEVLYVALESIDQKSWQGYRCNGSGLVLESDSKEPQQISAKKVIAVSNYHPNKANNKTNGWQQNYRQETHHLARSYSPESLGAQSSWQPTSPTVSVSPQNSR